MMSGELSFKEEIEKFEQTTVATTAGLVSMGKGASIGAAVGTICVIDAASTVADGISSICSGIASFIGF